MVERLNPVPATMESDLSYPAAAKLVQTAGLSAVSRWYPVRGGANNRVYGAAAGQRKVLLKVYFRSEGDARDRLRGEKAFYDLAESVRTTLVPPALGWDIEHRLGLFSFIDGRKPQAGDVSADRVRTAGRLVACVNSVPLEVHQAKELPTASEACFSIAEHFALVQQRVDCLHALPVRDAVDEDARTWIRDELAPCWRRLQDEAAQRVGQEKLDEGELLPLEQRWISPSDFGFHNALLDPENSVKFFDFEYAGWDDPAKLVADFFCQLAVPVPLLFWKDFVEALQEARGWSPAAERRAKILLPLYRIKWCCIALNEFLVTHAARRFFSDGEADERRAAQLTKAQKCLGDAKSGQLPGE
jgi:hypothetical protein